MKFKLTIPFFTIICIIVGCQASFDRADIIDRERVTETLPTQTTTSTEEANFEYGISYAPECRDQLRSRSHQPLVSSPDGNTLFVHYRGKLSIVTNLSQPQVSSVPVTAGVGINGDLLQVGWIDNHHLWAELSVDQINAPDKRVIVTQNIKGAAMWEPMFDLDVPWATVRDDFDWDIRVIWSPTGKLAAYTNRRGVTVYDVDRATTTFIEANTDSYATPMAWSPDGRTIVIQTFGGGAGLHFIDLDSLEQTTSNDAACFYEVDWSSTGQYFAVDANNQSGRVTNVYDAESHQLLHSFGDDARGVNRFVWSKSTDHLAYAFWKNPADIGSQRFIAIVDMPTAVETVFEFSQLYVSQQFVGEDPTIVTMTYWDENGEETPRLHQLDMTTGEQVQLLTITR